MDAGDKITISYKHWLNSKSYVVKTKHGILIRRIRKRNRISPTNIWTDYYLVKLVGNKGNSKVHLGKIKVIH